VITAALAMIRDESQRNELADFYERHKDRFFDIAFSRLHNNEDAEDVVQEAFSKIALHPEKFFEISHNKRVAYFDVIIRNTAIDIFRKKNRHPDSELSTDIPDNELELEDKIIGEISCDELKRFISSLPPLQKNVLELKAVYDLSISETAELLSISETAVRQRLYNARRAITKFINGGNKP